MYINGLGAISPQNTQTGEFPFRFRDYEGARLSCIEPDYKEYISPRTSRRMSRVVKMGVTAALMALKGGSPGEPDAIITGSGFGCMQDTEKFLQAITENQEKFLNPAPFIHSTHNTISSQVALLLKCTGYNQTYVQGPFSFESALLDAIMLIKDGMQKSVLVGGIDEMTPNLFAITKRFGLWKTAPTANRELLKSNSKGTMAGEGAGFFMMQKEQTENSFAKVIDVETVFGIKKEDEVEARISSFLKSNNLTIDELDLCFLGKNGDNRTDRLYTNLQTTIFKDRSIGAYKHLCGEYLTSSAFAVWMATQIISKQLVPDFAIISGQAPTSIGSVLIVNRYQAEYLSLILLQAC